MAAAALPYHEPGIVTILILSSFLILSNVVNWIFDRLLFCGLIGQIAIGVAWGTPGGNWLSLEIQDAIVQFGYLGLIVLVYEGGLQTDLKTLRSNLFLASLVAIIGIGTPMALSFTLQGFMNITPVQAFAAGAALCSTSLGTTFTILATSGLNQSRLGVVLSSAAMMDDVVGLVMSGIIASLGQSSDNFSAIIVIRPVFVSIAFAVLLPVICAFIVKPLTKVCYKLITKRRDSKLHTTLTTEGAAFCLHVAVLTALITGAIYAGTSGLFAAYLAGASISWWDALCTELRDSNSRSTVIHDETADSTSQDNSAEPKEPVSKSPESQQASPSLAARPASSSQTSPSTTSPPPTSHAHLHGTAIFTKHFSPALHSILQPFFFASIGFSIPISQMFTPSILWRGIVYSILMVLAKLFCGLCLIRFSGPVIPTHTLKNFFLPSSRHLPWPLLRTTSKKEVVKKNDATTDAATTTTTQTTPSPATRDPKQGKKKSSPGNRIPKPMSLYPATMLGFAMVARGEIGFLISAIAESKGVFGDVRGEGNGSSELFLVVTWAILLCTLLGPIVVGTMVKRIKRLQAAEREKRTGREDPLGIWGVLPRGSAAGEGGDEATARTS
ncbi:unnamed protein product [Zymoseptoria tritici ST99CH_3D7]|uniref:Cation/H+ exchanger transmembrane domain-containing protein n=1 Tax=Zymoseptoria tritici (strain ST99CH_3D7) TaxID=1276538 RepID=A0A1X7RE15_ZYMT9|nr:unnamed protein product [Zymoseptoria tritici ST99CH_3D7]